MKLCASYQVLWWQTRLQYVADGQTVWCFEIATFAKLQNVTGCPKNKPCKKTYPCCRKKTYLQNDRQMGKRKVSILEPAAEAVADIAL